MYDVLIVGGGLSGLSAAVELVTEGLNVALVERRPVLGGRTYSFRDEVTGDPVDNGQHLMLGCYHATRRYLDRIGASHLAKLQRGLQIEFLRPGGEPAKLSCPPLPAPFHVAAGLARLSTLSWKQRLALGRVGFELAFPGERRLQPLDEISVEAWLEGLGQDATARKYLWDIIAVGSLNNHPRNVSALLFYRVLRTAFFGDAQNASFLMPVAGLSEAVVDPAIAYVRAHRGNVRTRRAVSACVVRRGRFEGLRFQDGTTIRARACISAVPYHAVERLLPGEIVSRILPPQVRRRFKPSPIITANLWLDQTIMSQEVAALLDSRVHWVFNRTKILSAGQQGEGRQFLSLVISGAARYAQMTTRQLASIAFEDLQRVLPVARGAKLVHHRVIKEQMATFTPAPGLEKLRPSVSTGVPNFFLAGDWTATGLPATIEGAVISGQRAAGAVRALLHS